VRGEWPPCCATYGPPCEQGVCVLTVLRKPRIEKFKRLYKLKHIFRMK
jgi:hypothetical protein